MGFNSGFKGLNQKSAVLSNFAAEAWNHAIWRWFITNILYVQQRGKFRCIAAVLYWL